MISFGEPRAGRSGIRAAQFGYWPSCSPGVPLGERAFILPIRYPPIRYPLTAGFVYVRRHGTGVRYGGSYTEAMLREDARQFRGWLKEGCDVYVYFNNDAEAYAVRNAQRLRELVES